MNDRMVRLSPRLEVGVGDGQPGSGSSCRVLIEHCGLLFVLAHLLHLILPFLLPAVTLFSTDAPSTHTLTLDTLDSTP